MRQQAISFRSRKEIMKPIRRRKISDDTLEKITKNRKVTKDLKRKQLPSPTLGSNVQNAIEHLDNIVSKMEKTEDENDQFGRYVAFQLSSLSPIWSVMLRGEIQNAITKIVLESLSGQQSGTSKVFLSPFHRHPSQDASNYLSSVSSYHSRPSTPHTSVSQLSASPNPSSPLPYPPPSSSPYPSSPSLHPPSSPSLYPPPSPSLHPSPSPSLHSPLSPSHPSHSPYTTILPNPSLSNQIIYKATDNIEDNNMIVDV